jgi:hypothetical protein
MTPPDHTAEETPPEPLARYELDLTYTPLQARQATLAYLQKDALGALWLGAKVTVLLYIIVIFNSWFWAFELPYGEAFLFVATGVLAYFMVTRGFYYVNAMRLWQQTLRNPSARTVVLSTQGIVWTRDHKSRQYRWPRLVKLYRGAHVWLLLTTPKTYLLLPTAALSPELKTWLVAQCRQHRVPVESVTNWRAVWRNSHGGPLSDSLPAFCHRLQNGLRHIGLGLLGYLDRGAVGKP